MEKRLPLRIAAAVTAVETPAFVIDHAALESRIRAIRRILEPLECALLYSMKALPLAPVLRLLSGQVDGLAASSPFEVRLARSVMGDQAAIHFTAPGIHPRDVPLLRDACDFVACNSLHQYRMLGDGGRASLGLRVNVGIDFVRDPRYAPARPHSKLGIPLKVLSAMCRSGNELPRVGGIHIHHNSDSRNWSELAEVIGRVTEELGMLLPTLRWINLGGGYLASGATGVPRAAAAIARLRKESGSKVFMEPGAGVAADAGILVASVVDLFDSDGMAVAVLDTTINHHPNVFAYQSFPRVLPASRSGPYPFLLAGCSCLAGDEFGVHRFPEPLHIGSRVVFPSAGAYTLSKANMFNGIALPTIYQITRDGTLQFVGECRFEQFLESCAGEHVGSAEYAASGSRRDT